MVTNEVVGSAAWWQAKKQQGIPTVQYHRAEKICDITFWWRDPEGTERTSSIRRVWVYITGVTDHHQRSVPQSMSRIPDTNVWFWRTQLGSDWRGSYCFMPSRYEDDFAPEAFQEGEPSLIALRDGWSKLIPQAIADPFNPQSWLGGRGHPTSSLHLPDAPKQPGWDKPDTSYMPPKVIEWQSQLLGNVRRVWLFTTGEQQPEKRPLAILLDGQFWAESMPVWPALQAQTNAGALPEAVYLLIDAIDLGLRERELTCNPDFWLAVQQELLPLVAKSSVWRNEPSTTVVAGQSFGGLSALYAGLHWPQCFGCVLSQSGSYWWPSREAGHEGWLTEQLTSGLKSKHSLKIFMEAGVREPLIHQTNTRLYPLLQQAHHQVEYHEVEGGHDALCWRGGLIHGLSALWADVVKHPV